ncbi:NAD(P)H-dependent glycerol-3-phosphate dehydrogenase [Facklamia sp. DSM 111018]|uniref:Glycerol-3-phosphate dehydrogenase [NAD(P)+] n=1 Tax=Facklamia lactis TaxID=2749967 RepID=A0ABS0LQS4_9LACT|nr:NAD(P)H-dependent glycerol-3-phosphate dehydrogenase [Facklamia lactis]MBG9980697.1 NAD(P)H-dependent glycerol-3-phosphate dehydrogenase [Facklamia lactis]MBG9986511.1 NAD(P)H-dependent glycerol-3-phosphate dehydrogenase [Facklamia lactis]
MNISIIGSGSWGTALAKVLADNSHQVILWGLDTSVAEEINKYHTNTSYLPELKLPENIKASNDLENSILLADIILIALPTKAIRSVMSGVHSFLSRKTRKPLLVHVSKGLEQETHMRVSQIISDVVPRELYQEIVVLSGPSHAEEVAREDITTITAASESLEAAQKIQACFMNHYFRVYTNTDVIGVELGAALKNIIALGAGILHGLGYGDNAKAALITRGLAEISRLGIEMGADPLTFAGLSGVGDLIVTCTSIHSRNWQAGNLLAQGYQPEEVTQKVRMVVEGMSTCRVAYELAQQYQVEMPITEGLYQVIYEKAELKEVMRQLMSRSGKQEASMAQHEEK